MRLQEFYHIFAAILLFTVLGALYCVTKSQFALIPVVLFFAIVIIFASVFAKKLIARVLDCDVEHEIWKFSRYGFNPGHHFKKELPFGIILPLIISVFSLGVFKLCTFLSYEARALKKRAAKRFGFYSYTELTEWHNALIGAAGVIAPLLLALIAYFIAGSFPSLYLEYFAKLSIYYAFSNMIPLPKLDGSQIFFGSRVLYTALAVITLIFTLGAFVFLTNPC